MLALVASPRGQPPIDVRRALQSLRRLHEPGRIDVTIAPHASAAGLPGLIERAQPDMVIFLAHGRPGALILEDATGESETLRANDLATLLAARPGCTVVLASCYGATPDDAGRSTALALLAGGALAVVAISGPIPGEDADAFLAGLLDSLARGRPIEVAAAAGRQQIVARLGSRGGGWALPIYWQRALDRPLALPPQQAIRRGADLLAEQSPSWAAQLAAGGWLGLLAAFSIQSLFAPGGMTIVAIGKLLEGLGLNVMAYPCGFNISGWWWAVGGGSVPSRTLPKRTRGRDRDRGIRRRQNGIARQSRAGRRSNARPQALV